MGLVALAHTLPPSTLNEVRMESHMFVFRVNMDLQVIYCENRYQVHCCVLSRMQTETYIQNVLKVPYGTQLDLYLSFQTAVEKPHMINFSPKRYRSPKKQQI